MKYSLHLTKSWEKFSWRANGIYTFSWTFNRKRSTFSLVRKESKINSKSEQRPKCISELFCWPNSKKIGTSVCWQMIYYEHSAKSLSPDIPKHYRTQKRLQERYRFAKHLLFLKGWDLPFSELKDIEEILMENLSQPFPSGSFLWVFQQ